jgi:hypothetical protein
MNAPTEDGGGIEYELLVSPDGGATLTCGGEVMWVSDTDDDFKDEFGDEPIDFDDESQTDNVVGWLIDNDYIPPGAPVDIALDEESGRWDVGPGEEDDDEDDEEARERTYLGTADIAGRRTR